MQRYLRWPVLAELHLTHPEVAHQSLFEAHYAVPVRLKQSRSGVRLADGIWEMSVLTVDLSLRKTLLAVAEAVEIEQFTAAPLSYAIRTRLPETIQENRFSAERIARELGLSRRTLHRQLATEQMTFKGLLDSYRREETMGMLQAGERLMARIAYDLGYNEQSSFNRAFKRWAGHSSSNWLQQTASYS